MKAHGGFLIAAVMVLALATGCQKKSRSSNVRRSGLNGAPAPRPVVATTPAVQQPATQSAAPVVAASVNVVDKGRSVATKPSLAEARKDLNKLAEGALSLRAALLQADFKAPATAPAKKETSHVSR